MAHVAQPYVVMSYVNFQKAGFNTSWEFTNTNFYSEGHMFICKGQGCLMSFSKDLLIHW